MKKLFTLAALLLATGNLASAQFITRALDPATDEPTFDWSKTEMFIPIAISESVGAAMAGDVAFDATINDQTRFLYVWEGTYVGGEQDGALNSFGEPEDCIALDVANVGWSGCGFFQAGTDPNVLLWPQVLDDTWVLHFAIKSTDFANHRFAVGGLAGFTVGSSAFDAQSKLIGDFPRDGEWYYVDLPFSFIRQLDSKIWDYGNDGGLNYLTILSGGVQGTKLRLDNIFWYKDSTLTPGGDVDPGDVNGDGSLTIEDMNIILNILVGKMSADDYPYADVDESGNVSIDDLNLWINIFLGKD